MNREQIARRVDLVGPSTGTIVGVATWCALHGADADAIMNYMAEKMKHKDTTDAQRASLVYVIHELLLSCATRGVSDSAKRSILVAVSRTLPRAVQDTLRQRAGDHTAFLIALQKATEWWAMLKLFPAAWLAQLQGAVQHAQEEAGQRMAVPSALLHVANLLQRYQHAKEQWLLNRQVKADEGPASGSSGTTQPGGGAGASSAEVDDAARRCLIALRKAVDGRFERNAALLAWCEAERAELEGRSSSSSGGTGAASGAGVVKTEYGTAPHAATHGGGSALKEESGGLSAATASGANDEDDVLGSFFS